MKIGVIGAGGVGAYFAAALAKSGAEVHLLATERHVAPIAEHGITVTAGDGSPGFTIPLAGVSSSAESIGVCDAVILACKAGQVSLAMGSAQALIGPDTAVLPLQNGVTASERITETVGPGHALGGVAMIISYLHEPGIVHHVGGQPAITLGELDGTITPRATQLANALDAAGVSTAVSADIVTDMWRKFMLITSYGGVGALCREPVGRTRTNPKTRALVQDAMREVANLAGHAGANLGELDVARMMAQFDAFGPDSTASMQRDLAAGRSSELEDQNGTVVRLALHHGVPVPIHHTIYRAMTLLDGAAKHPSNSRTLAS
ncbi:ketopantoate reductase family protein [Specibacter sp. NPDC057265]|uniref:ketopantoate reductase family protein n=1 Tax=Specibacter sp. NPDC057265 TaxID=3346075 RepID=UPI00362F54ED